MPKEFRYTYSENTKDRITMDYSPEADEKMDISIENGVPFLYLNQSAMMTLAKTLIKIANGSYSEGFHLHLHKDFNADKPECLTVLLSGAGQK